MKIIHVDEEEMEMEFDIIGIGAPILNAMRRILIAEVSLYVYIRNAGF